MDDIVKVLVIMAAFRITSYQTDQKEQNRKICPKTFRTHSGY